jgi:capsular exopolysaccharide synthesis family protein
MAIETVERSLVGAGPGAENPPDEASAAAGEVAGGPSRPPRATAEAAEARAAPAAPEVPEAGEAPVLVAGRMNAQPATSAPSTPAQPGGAALLAGADELFRGIYTRAALGEAEVVAVCSAIAGEGKTTISLGLGITIAQDYPERRVLVVETDFRQPVFAADFGLEPAPGLADCLETGQPLTLAYRRTRLDNLYLAPAGHAVAPASRLLRSSRMARGVDVMRQSYDLVILDVPPVLATSDALLICDLADAVILVVRSGVTPAPLVKQAVDQLDAQKLRGVVLNGARSAVPRWLRQLCGL